MARLSAALMVKNSTQTFSILCVGFPITGQAVALAVAPGAATTFTERRLWRDRHALAALVNARLFLPALHVTYP